MFGFDFKFIDTSKLVAERVKDASFKNVGHALATIRKDAQASIDIDPESSKPGTPPNSREGKLSRAIVFDVDKATDSGIVGPRHSFVKLAGHAHEMGGEIEGDQFDPRPFMEPALEDNLDRFGESFRGSI